MHISESIYLLCQVCHDLPDLHKTVLPLLLLPQQVDAHELHDLVADDQVLLAEPAVLQRQAVGGRLQLDNVLLQLIRIVPRHLHAQLAFLLRIYQPRL